MSRAVWQISGGPTSRGHAKVFLRHAAALIGPGDAGAWNPKRDADAFEGAVAPVAYANLARLKQPAADLFARMQRP